MRKTLFILVLLLAACGKDKRQMHLVGLEGVSPEQKESILAAVKEFNTLAGVDVISTETGSFPIHVKVESQKDVNEITPAVSTGTIRNGFAVSDGEGCTVTLSEDIFLSETEAVTKFHSGRKVDAMSVQVHEFGHCAGLKHVDGENQVAGIKNIMAPSPKAYSAYTAEALDRFGDDLRAALGI